MRLFSGCGLQKPSKFELGKAVICFEWGSVFFIQDPSFPAERVPGEGKNVNKCVYYI
jgi:hypothetical protein